MKELLKYEFICQNRINNLIKYFCIYFIFCTISITVISPKEAISNIGWIFVIISIPLSLINLSSNFLKNEIDDGSLELLLTIFSPFQIIMAKYFSLFSCGVVAFLLGMPIFLLLFQLPLMANILNITLSCGLLLITSCAVIILVASVQAYFRSNTNFLTVIIMPVIIPEIIIAGLVLQDSSNFSLVMMMIGITAIITPITLYLTSYLIANIYHS